MENRFGTFGDNDPAKGSLITERISDIGNELINEHNTHIANTTNPHSVTKSQVGLNNVDNTSDSNKPVSLAQQAALDAINLKTINQNRKLRMGGM
ncbi:hypothetical protein [Acetobacterium wieringae]|uniref:hypothetical protein n=1 Tax=Acetobacterium wieringae TaxID=52694 RepID=UPI0026EB87A7|nr:hypothetical protein [Acetobacterium wieringae]